jgi:hypothetical protein
MPEEWIERIVFVIQKEDENINHFMTISRKSLPGVGKGGEPNILTRQWQKRRTEDFD